ncbi:MULTISPECIES: CGNR zinc finger domain-containing protein [unclassified Streptomyces]|uniref:CGNR zinc finger domain-containing protein n=1 Tax=unclassified Streptomyces TaxID=2593676 RepID=UPI000CD5B55E|nr:MULTISPECIES: CGNR zinc finger domain-containing protein [unclassified Streptomyces]
MREGFTPELRLIDLANAVRADPGISRDGLARVLRAHGEPDAALTPERFGEADAASLRAAVTALTGTLFVETDTDRAAEEINTLLTRCAGPPRLSRHDGLPWHLHIDREADAPWADWFTASAALVLAQLLTTHARVTWGVCQATRCEVLYLGNGPGSPRRYCSARCSSRARVAAHRRRSALARPAP